MNIRLRIEKTEKDSLSPYAMLSENSKGRKLFENKCTIRTDFQRDRDRIIHSKSFRRLKHKTQVFIAPEGDHFRTRLTHTLEVAQIGRTLARALLLNEDLVEAIALGHDLGHTPFGHTGERVLNKLHPKGFKHNEQSIRVVDFLEHKDERIGLNLTYEVREGIINHSGGQKSQTLEGQVVKYADRIAYINHDIDDAIRAGVIKKDDLPKECIEILGKTHGERINTMILDIIENSIEKNYIVMSEDVGKATNRLRDYMFENVYLNKNAKSEESKAEYVLEQLYMYYLKNTTALPEEHLKIYKNIDCEIEDIICDYIAGTTDRYAVNLFNNIFIPKPWQKY
ncbi:dGTPase [Tissierella praeacuta DSM 18095]|uniref:Deoxyguanosinetriphosphate triphosphohydrolase-like protein n=1 Tax=Tissierella praeacuta DSM 18095 TaxID=1123404 RepID=A0A1M4S972_9FIRM|nr:deoxyguanosinetriphosphate triphosphohydrolase [Tissierella praeacuta]TCU71736.1 dGTPase [Tissierella praeacuta]SHE28773.1 dGTPase [Tissierella praeacuta DSM 18095]SUP01152.1 Deoxyguanosinetriphosphate triphosphohydrolase [Tissierella praeacuta]